MERLLSDSAEVTRSLAYHAGVDCAVPARVHHHLQAHRQGGAGTYVPTTAHPAAASGYDR